MKFQKLSIILSVIIFSFISILISANKSLWRDEAFSILISNKSLIQTIKNTSNDFSPPLFYLFLNPWHKIVGNNDILLRLLPLLFSLLTLIISQLFLLKILPKKHINYYYIFFPIITLNLVNLYFSAELRPYSLLILLCLLSLIFFQKSLDNPSNKNLVYLALINLLALYTHSIYLIFIISQIFILTAYLIFTKKYKTLLKYSIFYLSAFIFFSPWLYIMFFQTKNFQNSFWIEFDKLKSLKEYFGLFYINEGFIKNKNLINKFYYLSQYLFIIGFISILKKTKKFCLTLSILLTNLLSIYFISKYFNPLLHERYIAFLSIIAIFIIFYSFIFIKNKSNLLFTIIFIYYLYLNINIAKDFTTGVAKTNYKFLQTLKYSNIYSDEALDIMPCVYYNPNCKYVGNEFNSPKYTGVNSINSINQIVDWSEIHDKFLFTIVRERRDRADKFLTELNYEKKAEQNLGEDVVLKFYKKKI